MTERSNRRRTVGAVVVLIGILSIVVIGLALALVLIPITATVSSNEFVPTTTTTTTPPTNGLVLNIVEAGALNCGAFPDDFSTGPLALSAIDFDLNGTDGQAVNVLCATKVTDTDIDGITVQLVTSASGEAGCSTEEGSVDPEGVSCGTAGELADLLRFNFTAGSPNGGGTCQSGTVSVSSPATSLGSFPVGSTAGTLCVWGIIVEFDGTPTDAQKLAASTDSAEFTINVTAVP